MSYAALIPVLYRDVLANHGIFPAVRYFVDKGVVTALAVNGCTLEECASLMRMFDHAGPHFHLIYAGEEANPYTARNYGIEYLFYGGQASNFAIARNPRVDAVALIDSDTEVDDDYHEKLSPAIHPSALIAGRIYTRVPRGVSRHLDWLADQNFECFDGYGPPDSTIGANMIIGSKVYADVGPMKCDVISGGDADYSTRARDLGYQVTKLPAAAVRKVIHKYSARVIMEKQARRSLCLNPDLVPSEDEILCGLRNCLRKQLDILENKTAVRDLKEEYAELIDSYFAVIWHEGLLAKILDRESPK